MTNSPRTHRLLAAACLFLFVVPAARAQREEPRKEYLRTSPKVLSAFRDVVAKPSEATVRVRCEGKEAALGTVVHTDGWVLTKYSLLKGNITVKLRDGREVNARLFGVHEQFDLGLLKIEANKLAVVEWADSKTAPVGNWLATPGLDGNPLAVGVVSVALRKLPPRGGPTNPATTGYLGVALDTDGTAAKVTQVLKDTAAERAGLKVNDLILSVGGKNFEDLDHFMTLLGKHKPGETVELKIKRGDKEMDVKATLGKRQPGRADYQNSLGGELSERRGGFPEVLQHDTVLKPGDCGGPVVDLDGKAIGINIARAGRTETYAVPYESIKPLLPELMSGRLAPKEEKPKELTEAEKKVAEARAALARAQGEKDAVEKKLAEARAALEKAEAELKAQKAEKK